MRNRRARLSAASDARVLCVCVDRKLRRERLARVDVVSHSVHNLEKVALERRAADEEAVHVTQARQRVRRGWHDTPSVDDARARGGVRADILAKPPPNLGVNLLHLLRRRNQARADGPYRCAREGIASAPLGWRMRLNKGRVRS